MLRDAMEKAHKILTTKNMKKSDKRKLSRGLEPLIASCETAMNGGEYVNVRARLSIDAVLEEQSVQSHRADVIAESFISEAYMQVSTYSAIEAAKLGKLDEEVARKLDKEIVFKRRKGRKGALSVKAEQIENCSPCRGNQKVVLTKQWPTTR